MKNAEKFRKIFKEFATEVWAFPEKDFLTWLNAEYEEPTTKNNLGVDLISRADVDRLICEYRDDATETGNERDLERAYGANAVGELISELPSVTPQLSVPEVTALAEWTEKLTKASEDAYNKGYEDGMKAQAEPKTKIEESNFSREQYALDIDTAWKRGYEVGKKENIPVNICPHCGEYIGAESEE